MSTGRIIVGVDGSESSKDALRWAKAQADRTGEALVAIAAWSYPVTSYPTLTGYVPMGDAIDMERDTRTALEAVVKETLDGAEVAIEIAEGHPANVLVDAARDAALVVVGCRGHGGFVGALIGSVSQYVVTHAPCPVVVVRHPKHVKA